MATRSRSPAANAAAASAARTPVHRRPGIDFSVNGFVYSAMMLFMGIAAMNLQASLLFGVFGLMVGVLLSSAMLSKIIIKRVQLRREVPDQATVGRPALIHYTLTNPKRFSAGFSITISELDGVQSFRRQPHAYVLHVAPRMSATVVCEVTPRRRGLTQFDRYQLSTGFPFGFVKRAVLRRASESMLIFPPVGRVDRALLQRFRSAETQGASLRPKLHGNDEFYGLREFRAGESQRNIYWRRSARTGTLVAREMTHASPPRIMVVLDTHNPGGSAGRGAEIETSIAQAASLIDGAVEAGLAVGLVARSADGWARVAPSRGKQHKRELLTILAKLPSGASVQPQDATAAMAQASGVADSLTTLVLMTGGIESRAAAARRGSASVVIGCNSAEARGWFTFDRPIDFGHAGPLADLPLAAPAPTIHGRFKSLAGLRDRHRQRPQRT